MRKGQIFLDLGELLRQDMDGAGIGFGPEDEPSEQELVLGIYREMKKRFPAGLCANKDDHEAHPVLEGSLAPFWCTADQSQREPWRSEQRRRLSA